MKTYQQTKSLKCEASLISLKELAKKKDGEAADGKVNCEKSKFVFVGCVSIFYNDQEYIFISYAKWVLADQGKTKF